LEVDAFFEPIKEKWSCEMTIDDHGQKLIKEIWIDKCGKKTSLCFSDGERVPLEDLGDLVASI